VTSAAAAKGAWAEFVPPLREAALTAIVAAALMLPLIGLHAASRSTGIVIRTRWPEMLIAVGLIFAGRLALALERDGRGWPAARRRSRSRCLPRCRARCWARWR